MALVNGLPPGSALHRAMEAAGELEPQLDLTQSILWRAVGALEHANYYWRGYLRVRPDKDKFRWPSSPYESLDNGQKSYGHVAPEDQAAAADFLISMYQ